MFSGASGTPSSWTEQSFLLTPYFTTDGGNTLTPSVLYAGSWTSGGDYLYTDAAVGGNWVVITKGTGLTFTPNSFQIAQRSGTHTLISSTGAEVTVTGGVGDTFTFPVTVDWANLSSLTLYSESGDLGFDTFIFSLCPDPYIIGNVTVDEGSGLTLYASTEGLSPTYSWDLDGDGQYNDATGDTVLFNASALDGPSTVEVGLEVEADCGVAGVLTMATSRTISILNVEPSITSFGGDSSGAEGSSLSWSAAVSDPAAADTVSTSWDFGDGSPPVTGGLSQSYSYADNGTYSVTITATDDDGDSASDTLAVSVANALPTVSVTSLPDGDEGESLSFEASVSDPGTADILTTTWDFGDGSPNGTGTTVTHSYADNGSYTVTTTVEDDDGGTIATSGSVTIDNVSPSLTQTSIPSSGDEGETLNFEATATDPGNDTITTSWDFGDGSPTVQGTPTDHSWADEGSYTLVLTVSDEDGGSEELQSTITISNLAPSIGTFAVPSGVEGEVLNFAASATDPGSDTLSFLWNFGDGSPSVTAAQTTHVFDDEGSYTVSLTVSDGDGGTDTASGSSVLTNAAPSIDSLTGNTTGLEGQTLSWTAVVTDPGAADSVTVEWTFGDASSPATGSSVSHAYPDEGTFVITAVASDNDGASTTAYLTVTVSNDGPSITSMTVPAGQEGSPVSVSAEATDPGGDVLTYSWDFGDGSPATSGQSLSHTYDDDGTYVVQVTATDPVGASSSLSTAAVIANVAPSIDSLSAPSSGLEGESLSFSATASDPSAADTITLSFSWDFGDGSEPASGSTATHTYDDDGTFTVTLTVGDGDGSTAQSTAALTVANAAPTLLTTPGTTATEGSLYAYDGYATDPGADLLNWSLSTAPTGMTVHSVTGLVNWTPTLSQSLEGDHAVTLVVDDGDGGSSEQSWTIAVSFLDDDADEMADGWELDYGLDPSDPNDATLDPDNDGWTNLDEFLQGASPLSFDGPGAPTPTSPLDEDQSGPHRHQSKRPPDRPAEHLLRGLRRLQHDPADRSF